MEEEINQTNKIYGNNVAVVGRLTSNNPDVVIQLLKLEHNVYLVNPKKSGEKVHDLIVYPSLQSIPSDVHIDTIILYMNPENILNSHVYDGFNHADQIIFPTLEQINDTLSSKLDDLGLNFKVECPRVVLSQLYQDKYKQVLERR